MADEYELPTTEQLALIDKQDLTKVNWETLVQMGMDCWENKGYSQWLLGKLADRVTNPPSEKLAEEGEETETEVKPKQGALKEYAAAIKANYNSLMQYGYIYRKYISEDPNFHPLKYHGSISWGVLALVGTKSDQPIQLLEKLHDQNQTGSIEQAAHAIKEIEAEAKGEVLPEIPKKPNVRLEWETDRQLYRIVIDPEDFPKIDFSAVKADLLEYLEGLS